MQMFMNCVFCVEIQERMSTLAYCIAWTICKKVLKESLVFFHNGKRWINVRAQNDAPAFDLDASEKRLLSVSAGIAHELRKFSFTLNKCPDTHHFILGVCGSHSVKCTSDDRQNFSLNFAFDGFVPHDDALDYATVELAHLPPFQGANFCAVCDVRQAHAKLSPWAAVLDQVDELRQAFERSGVSLARVEPPSYAPVEPPSEFEAEVAAKVAIEKKALAAQLNADKKAMAKQVEEKEKALAAERVKHVNELLVSNAKNVFLASLTNTYPKLLYEVTKVDLVDQNANAIAIDYERLKQYVKEQKGVTEDDIKVSSAFRFFEFAIIFPSSVSFVCDVCFGFGWCSRERGYRLSVMFALGSGDAHVSGVIVCL